MLQKDCIKTPVILLTMLLLLACTGAGAQSFTIGTPSLPYTLVNKHLLYLEDKTNSLSLQDVVARPQLSQPYSNGRTFGLTNATYWFTINVYNATATSDYVLNIANGSIDSIAIYKLAATGNMLLPSINLRYSNPNPLYDLKLQPGEQATYILRIRSSKPLSVPVFISSTSAAVNNISFSNILFGIYFGIALVMFFYNFFIYFTTRDKNYLFYILYIIFLVVTQVCLQGYIKFLKPGSDEYLLHISVPLATSFVGIFSSLFIMHFLNMKQTMPWFHKCLLFFIGVYLVTICLSFAGYLLLAQTIIQLNTVIGIFIAIFVGIRIQRKGFKPAFFFNISWTFFLISVVIFILKDAGILPFNAFTHNSILFGSSIEITLLSFALADKINVLRKEKEASQAQALAALQENERIIKEQNQVLEMRVNERTQELKESNEELNKTLEELKDAQTQLVESEKMASLGQLTAGIAHEINNPINFVTSNVVPLQRDISMLYDAFEQIESLSVTEKTPAEKEKLINGIKEEIEYDYLKEEIEFLLKGIQEGSQRTAEIVRGLRIFSRVDEDDIKKVNIHDGIDATITIINSLLNNHIQVMRNYSELPVIDCYPGKLNQVFLNILTNAIHAVNKRWEQRPGGMITITTSNLEGQVTIILSDNGTGMDEQTAKHIFEPFFTTKDAGEGTGLGLSIVYNIIKKHNGTISVQSAPGEGTTFTIILPVNIA